MPDHTIAENLTRLQTARTNIASAITTKGGTVAAGAGFEDFSTAIGTIPAGGGDDSFAKLVDRSITSAVIPSGTTTIGAHAFDGCLLLTSVTIPSGVTTIGDYAFNFCSRLPAVNIPSGVTSIGDFAFANCTSVNLNSITLPSSVTSLGKSAFRESHVRSLDLSATRISTVNENLVFTCTSLGTVLLPSTITAINRNAFTNCTSLTSIIIPANVATIAGYVFSGCTSLTSIKFEPTTPPTVANANAWTSLPTTCTIQVPTGSLTAYTTANNYPNPNTYTYVEY